MSKDIIVRIGNGVRHVEVDIDCSDLDQLILSSFILESKFAFITGKVLEPGYYNLYELYEELVDYVFIREGNLEMEDMVTLSYEELEEIARNITTGHFAELLAAIGD